MISVRPYQPSDYPALKALYESNDTFGGQFDTDRDSEQRINKQIAFDKDSVLVAEKEGKLVGSVSILQNPRLAWLMRFAVAAEYEQEVTQSLFEEASRILKEKGHLQVLVYAAKENGKFRERYLNLGFAEGNSYTSFFRELS